MVKTLEQMEQKLWDEWIDAIAHNDTDLSYEEYFDAAMGSFNDMREDV